MIIFAIYEHERRHVRVSYLELTQCLNGRSSRGEFGCIPTIGTIPPPYVSMRALPFESIGSVTSPRETCNEVERRPSPIVD